MSSDQSSYLHKKDKTATELKALYEQSDSNDQNVFAEMRSNLLLYAGDHFQRKGGRFWNRIRQSRDLSEQQKLRLTKNHIHKIARHYMENINGFAPGVQCVPHDDKEIQDQKAAQLNQSIWKDAQHRYFLREEQRRWLKDFVVVGECATKIIWNPNKGKFLGYEQQVSDAGEPMFEANEMGEMCPCPDEDRPVFEGDFEFERLYPFNIFREPGAKRMEDSAYFGYRKMVPTKVLEKQYGEKFETSEHAEFVIFDTGRGEYNRTKEHTLVLEFFFKPSTLYPNGYFYITTPQKILEQGELPFGIWPIVWQGFDEFPTHPRGRSILKIARPYQAEINRASSAAATHQITIGDDKVLYQHGTKLSPGALLPGVRGIAYSGVPPTILPGRDGGQYVPYIERQISEMYSSVDLMEDSEMKDLLVKDSQAMLFASMKQIKRFSQYGEKYEDFLIKVCRLYLKLAKHYMPENWVIQAVGKNEQVNIPEFKSSEELHFQIKLEPKNDTIETLFGKQLTIQNILQYVGKDLDKDVIGKLIREMPYANAENAFDDLTIDYDNAKNIMLSIERGETPLISPNDNFEYILKRISHRKKQASFAVLSPEVQQMYQQVEEFLQMRLAEQLAKIQAAKNEFIPIGGAMVAADFYVEDPKDPSKAAKRARFPYQALEWLKKNLEQQGMALDRLEEQNQTNLANIADTLLQGRSPQLPGAEAQLPPQTQGNLGYGTD